MTFPIGKIAIAATVGLGGVAAYELASHVMHSRHDDVQKSPAPTSDGSAREPGIGSAAGRGVGEIGAGSTRAPVNSPARDARLAILEQYDPSPSGHRVCEPGELAAIAERNLRPIDPCARYTAVALGLQDINNELEFWGHDCMVPFAAATGVDLKRDGSVDIAKSMAKIDRNGDGALSGCEITRFNRAYDDVKSSRSQTCDSATQVTDAMSWSPELGPQAGSVVSGD